MRVSQAALLLLLFLCGAWATPEPGTSSAIVRGAAISPGKRQTFVTWGDAVLLWRVPEGKPRPLAKDLQAHFGEGGCFADVNGDGRFDLVLNRLPDKESAGLGKLVWLEAPNWQEHLIDTGIEMSECQETRLLGKRGVLMVQRHAQVRFYSFPPAESNQAIYQEVYSFYTPSREAGLARADVDGDGLLDIFSGNYWIQSPKQFELPWRLFAIELYNETRESATLRLVAVNAGKDIFVAQREMADARVAWLERPRDPKVLWTEHRLEAPGGFHYAKGLAVMQGINNRSESSIIVGEDNGDSSRMMILDWTGSKFPLVFSAKIQPVIDILAVDSTRFIALHRHCASIWEFQGRKNVPVRIGVL
jgi:hypothetical protein